MMTDNWLARLNRNERRAIAITIAVIVAIGIAGGLALAWLGRL